MIITRSHGMERLYEPKRRAVVAPVQLLDLPDDVLHEIGQMAWCNDARDFAALAATNRTVRRTVRAHFTAYRRPQFLHALLENIQVHYRVMLAAKLRRELGRNTVTRVITAVLPPADGMTTLHERIDSFAPSDLVGGEFARDFGALAAHTDAALRSRVLAAVKNDCEDNDGSYGLYTESVLSAFLEHLPLQVEAHERALRDAVNRTQDHGQRTDLLTAYFDRYDAAHTPIPDNAEGEFAELQNPAIRLELYAAIAPAGNATAHIATLADTAPLSVPGGPAALECLAQRLASLPTALQHAVVKAITSDPTNHGFFIELAFAHLDALPAADVRSLMHAASVADLYGDGEWDSTELLLQLAAAYRSLSPSAQALKNEILEQILSGADPNSRRAAVTSLLADRTLPDLAYRTIRTRIDAARGEERVALLSAVLAASPHPGHADLYSRCLAESLTWPERSERHVMFTHIHDLSQLSDHEFMNVFAELVPPQFQGEERAVTRMRRTFEKEDYRELMNRLGTLADGIAARPLPLQAKFWRLAVECLQFPQLISTKVAGLRWEYKRCERFGAALSPLLRNDPHHREHFFRHLHSVTNVQARRAVQAGLLRAPNVLPLAQIPEAVHGLIEIYGTAPFPVYDNAAEIISLVRSLETRSADEWQAIRRSVEGGFP